MNRRLAIGRLVRRFCKRNGISNTKANIAAYESQRVYSPSFSAHRAIEHGKNEAVRMDKAWP